MTDQPRLSLFNTLTRRVEPVELIQPGMLSMYSCGPTVYSYAHIGNFRTFLTADLIARVARTLGLEVRYVTNITDVGHLTEDDTADAGGEDRMERALSSEEGKRFENVWDLARHFTEALLDDWSALNLLEPTVRPRATEHIRDQILAVEGLVEKNLAYETDQGVYFSVDAFPNYGRLSGNLSSEDLVEAGRELVSDPGKRSPRDFALWKKDPHHLMQWYSPWGWGFPGWHIECSVMANRYLGDTIDVHAGGEDLIFPHHECEIAQAEGLSGKPFALHWVHTRFLQVEGEKMSKRLGNWLTVRDVIAPVDEGGRGVDPIALRLALISGQYRKPFNFVFDTLKASAKHVETLRSVFDRAEEGVAAGRPGPDDLAEPLGRLRTRIVAAMADDLNVPEALALILEGARMIRSNDMSGAAAGTAVAFMQLVNELLGIPRSERGAGEPTAIGAGGSFQQRVDALVRERDEARRARDFERADRLRNEISELGVEVMDSPDGSTWKLKPPGL